MKTNQKGFWAVASAPLVSSVVARFGVFLLSCLLWSSVGWGQVSVTATLGTTGPTTYTTVSAAFAAVNAGTHKGVITINITGNTTEPGSPTALLASSGTSSYTAITIKPSGGNYTIAGTITASRAIIELNGADNVTIDGDDPSVAGSRNLTIGFSSTAATAAACIRVSSNSTTGADGASNNTIKNCIITGNRSSANTTATYGINMSNYSTTSLTTGGYSSINNRFENNLITRCYHGIWAVGTSATYPNTGLQIINNVFGDNTLAGNIGNRAIIMSYTATTEAQAAIISGNEVVGVGDPGTTGYSASIAGFEIGTVNFGAKIYNNYIHDVKQPSTSGYGSYGVLFSGATTTDSLRFYNNIITRITASNFATTSLSLYTNYGVKMTAGPTFGDFSNNTIVLSTANPTGTTANPFSYALACEVNGVRIVNFRNNIIVNTNASTAAVGIYTNNNAIFSSASYTGVQIWDKNCYWVPSGILGYAAGTAATTFSAWKTASGKDGTSYNVNPNFVSASDLHINGSVASLLESGGMATSFNTDFDGQVRPGPAGSVNGGATNFDIGADEFDGIPITPVSITSASATANSCTAVAHTVTATVVQGTNAITSVVLSYTLNGTAQTPITMTNTSGNSWQATIPAATPTNATIAWTVTATDPVSAPTASGTYQDDPLNGLSMLASTSPTSSCANSNVLLNASLASSAAAPTTYCSPAYTGTYAFLGSVSFNTLSLSNAFSTSPYFAVIPTSTTTTTVTAGMTYSLTLSSIPDATAATTIASVWFDWNRNGVFEASEWVQPWTSAASGTVSITVPANAVAGLTRMRVRTRGSGNTNGSGDACTSFGSGSGADFIITVNGGPTGLTLAWSDGTNSIGSGNNASWTPSTAGTYNLTVSGTNANGCSISSSPLAVNVNSLPSAPTATNSVQCGSGIPTATVASTTGLATPTFVWYAAQTGGTSIQNSTATTFGTSISATTTFYVSEFNGTCESVRTPLTATVNTPPAITTSGPATICQGQSTTISVSSSHNGYTYSWSNNGGSGASVSVSPSTTTNYVVTATDNSSGQPYSGCTISSGATATTITVNATPSTVTITPTLSSICSGQSTTLNATGGTISGAYINGGLTTINSATGALAPLSNYYGGNKTQWMYTAAELTAMGYVAGDQITSLGFAVSAVGASFSGTLNNFTIALKNAPGLTALTTTFETGLTQVASLNWVVPTTNLPTWTYVTFATPFTWDGTSSVVFQTSFSNVNTGSSATTVQTYLTAGASNYASYYRTDGATATTVLAATSATVSTSRPDCRLGWTKLPTWSWNPSSSQNSSITVSPTLTSSYSAIATGFNGCTSSASVTINYSGTPLATAPSNGAYVFGATSNTNYNTAANWYTYSSTNGYAIASAVPTSSDVVVIPATGTCVNAQPSLSASASITDVEIQSGAVLSLNGNTLSIAGALTGAGTIKGSASSSLSFTGSSNNTLKMDQSTAGTTNVLKNLTLSGTGTTTLGNALNITAGANSGSVTAGAGTTLTTGGFLRLKSDASGTARIAQSAGTISGNVTQERYVPGKAIRKWSFLASPVTQSLTSAWQQQIHITGAGTGGTMCNNYTISGTMTPHTNGFDVTQLQNPSFYTYDAATDNFVANTTGTTNYTLTPGVGYMVLVRGDRNDATNGGCVLLSANNQAAFTSTPVTLAATGAVGQGTITKVLPAGYSFIGNPYPCEIDFPSFNTTNASVISGGYWTYYPTNATYTFSTYNNGTSTNGGTQVIANGQSFLVNSTSGGTITFNEAHKSTTANNGNFRLTKTWDELIRVGLSNNQGNRLDEVVVRFGNDAAITKALNEYDAASVNGGDQWIKTLKDANELAIQTRPNTYQNDTVSLAMHAKNAGIYQLNFSEYQGLSNTEVYLIDQQENLIQNVKALPSYQFSVGANTTTANRFKLIFDAKTSGVAALATKAALQVYPNPTKDKVRITCDALAYGVYQIKVRTITGAEVLKAKGTYYQNEVIELSLQDLAAGMYMLELTQDNGLRAIQKITKQ